MNKDFAMSSLRCIAKILIPVSACAVFLISTAPGAHAGVGTMSGEVLDIVADPVIQAMGGGGYALPSDMPAAFLATPAALSGVTRPKVAFNVGVLPGELQYHFAGFTLPTTFGNIGTSLFYLSYGSFDGYNASGESAGMASSYDAGAVVGYSIPIKTTMPVYREYGSLGINLKLLHSQLSDYSAEAIAVDIGGIYNIPFLKGLSAGAVYKNFGSSMKYVTRSNPLPSSMNFGLGYANSELMNLALAADYSTPDQGASYYSFGASFSPVYYAAIRAGVQQREDTLQTGFSTGIGLEIGDFRLDYTFTPVSYFSPEHHIGICTAVGDIMKMEAGSDYYLNRHFREASASYYKKDYITARRQFEDILSIYPGHQPSQRYLEKIMTAIDTMERERDANITKWMQKADRAAAKRDYVTGGRYYHKILEAEPDNGSAKAGLENIAKLVDEVKLEKLRQQNVQRIVRLWKSAQKKFHKGDLVHAKQEFNSILTIDPEHEGAKYFAVEIDNQLSKIAASKINELYSQGTDLYQQGKYEDATRYFEAVVIAAPHRLDAQDYVKQCQQNIEERDARAKAEQLARDQERMSNEMSSVYDRALRAYERGSYESALASFVKSEELADKYEFKEYLESARTYISTLKRSLSEKHYKTGFNHYRNNNFEAAFAEYRRAIDYNPENTSAQVELDRVGKDLAQKYFEQGMSYFSRSEMDKAREMFKKSLSYQPDKPESLRALERIR